MIGKSKMTSTHQFQKLFLHGHDRVVVLFQSRRGPESTFRRALVCFRFRHRQSDRQRLDERLRKYRRIRAAFTEDAAEMSVAFGDGDDEIMVRLANVLQEIDFFLKS